LALSRGFSLGRTRIVRVGVSTNSVAPGDDDRSNLVTSVEAGAQF